MAETFGILLLVVVAPLWIIFHYITMMKQSKTLTGDDERMLDELYQSADQMEGRLRNIERILDAENPDWRKEV